MDTGIRGLPPVCSRSEILTVSMMNMLYLTNSQYAGVDYFPVLYNSGKDGLEYFSMVDSLRHYDGPIMILVKQQAEVPSSDSEYNLFGAYLSMPVHDGGVYFGDQNTYLFSLYPNFEPFYAKDLSFSGFALFDSRSQIDHIENPEDCQEDLSGCQEMGGLGFGRTSDNKCRLWLDANLRKSYIGKSDETFMAGQLSPNSDQNNLKIETIEILGCGDYAVWENYMANRAEMEFIKEKHKLENIEFLKQQEELKLQKEREDLEWIQQQRQEKCELLCQALKQRMLHDQWMGYDKLRRNWEAWKEDEKLR